PRCRGCRCGTSLSQSLTRGTREGTVSMVDSHLTRWLRIFRDDRTGIAFPGILSILRGVSSLPLAVNTERTPVHFFEQLAGPQVWAWVWIALGVLCLVSTLADRLSPAAVGGTITIHAAWGLSFLAEWVFGDSSRAWVSALGYIAVTGLFLWAI